MNPMKIAHEITRQEMSKFSEYYGTYAKCFAEQLKAVYDQQRYEVRMQALYGGLCPGFQVIEPKRIWA